MDTTDITLDKRNNVPFPKFRSASHTYIYIFCKKKNKTSASFIGYDGVLAINEFLFLFLFSFLDKSTSTINSRLIRHSAFFANSSSYTLQANCYNCYNLVSESIYMCVRVCVCVCARVCIYIYIYIFRLCLRNQTS
jgi:hypothetical protein